jgi:putative tricarboxylic transport membrane protein
MIKPVIGSTGPVPGESSMARPPRRNWRDLVAGTILVGLGLFGLALVIGHLPAFQVRGNPVFGTLQQPLSMGHGVYLGAGNFPLGLFALLVIVGAAIALCGAGHTNQRLERWYVRPSISIISAVVCFAVAIRPLGLLAVGPMVIVIGSLASKDCRWREVFSSAIAVTAGCIIVFRYLLKLPIPIAPWLGW